jgi:quercetin dioxygenase-like cupin family protein
MIQAAERGELPFGENVGNTRQKMTLFRRADAISVGESHAMDDISFPEGAQAFIAEFDFAALGEGAITDLVFRHAGPDGYSIVRAWFAPGYLLPRHSHDADCAYYITAGELRLGRQVLGTGEGFFVPKEHPYSYEAGPDGVEVIEFRHATTFNMRFVDEEEERWTRVFQRALANQAGWSEMRAERLGSGAGQRVTQRLLKEEACQSERWTPSSSPSG